MTGLTQLTARCAARRTLGSFVDTNGATVKSGKLISIHFIKR